MADTSKAGRAKLDIGMTIAVMALALSAISFYRSYIYTKQQLDVTVTEVSYVTNQGELYVTVAFSNGGNRDAALLRVEPVLWSKRGRTTSDWLPIVGRVHDNIPPTVPKMPAIVKAGEMSTFVTRSVVCLRSSSNPNTDTPAPPLNQSCAVSWLMYGS